MLTSTDTPAKENEDSDSELNAESKPPANLAPIAGSSFYSNKTNARWSAKLDSFRRFHTRQQQNGKEGFFVWRVFSTQERAFRFADGRRGEGFAVWAFEGDKTAQGKRRYLVARKDDFWNTYRKMEMTERHYYEIVREGVPCRLYFDLELNRDINFLRDGPRMVQRFIVLVLARIRKIYGTTASESDVLQLDSSTDAKFSRHLIFHLPAAAWRNNAHVGDFVRDLCLALEQEANQMSAEEAVVLSPIVKDEKGHDTLFVDQTVYSKNRNFRLIWSSKIGKTVCFDISSDNKFPLKRQEELGFLLDSLASYVAHRPGLRILEYRSNEPKKRGLSSRTAAPNLGAAGGAEDPYDRSASELRSPFPDVDDWVARQIATRPGKRGRIKSVLYFPDVGTIVYNIEGNKYCDAIGREHKSNGTYCYVKLSMGLLFFKCYDAECKKVGTKIEVPLLLLNPEKDEVDENLDPEDDLIPDDELLQTIAADNSQQWY